MRARWANASLLFLLTAACGGGGQLIEAIEDRAQIQDWARTVDGTGERYGRDVATNGRGTVFLVGTFNASAVFGSGERNEVTLDSTGGWNSYIAAYQENGDFEWATSIEGENVFVQAVAADDRSRIAVVGFTSGSAIFRFPGGLPLVVEAAPGGEAGFLAVYDVDGTLSWMEPFVGDEVIEALDVDFGQDGNLLVGGSWIGTATFGADVLTAAAVNGFLLGYAPDGTLISEFQTFAEPPSYAAIWSVARFDDGDAVIAGDFQGTVSLGVQVLTSDAGSQDMYCARISYVDGTIWANRLGGPGIDSVFAVDANGRDTVAVAGVFTQPPTTGPGGDPIVTHEGLQDAFVAEFGESGNRLWARSIGGIGVDSAFAVALGRDDSVVVTGLYNLGELHLGSGATGPVTLSAPPGAECDGFVARYDENGIPQTGQQFTGLGQEFGMGAVLNNRDSLVVSGTVTAEATIVRDGVEERTLPVTGDRGAVVLYVNPPRAFTTQSAP